MPPRRAWLLALGAVGVRAAAAFGVAVLHSDAARNLRMAELITQGRLHEALLVRHPTPPLHPFLSALLDPGGQHLLLAGSAVSVVLGGLALLPLYALARRAWDERVATLAGFLYALLPAIVDLHAEATTEACFMFFFLGGLAAGWSALEDGSWERTIVAALFSLLAWLSRPEGIYLIPLFLAAALLHPRRFSLAAVPIFLIVWGILAFPYLAFIHAQTGAWRPSLSGIPGAFGSLSPGPRWDPDEARVIAQHGALLGAAGIFAGTLFGKVLFYVLGPFLLAGFWKLRPGRLGAWLLLAAGGYLVPVAVALFIAMPFSFRFLLLPAALLLPIVALGLLRVPKFGVPLIALILVAMLVRDLRPRRSERLPLKEAGLALLQEIGPGRPIFATERQVEFYARSAYVPWPTVITFADLERIRPDACVFSFVDPRLVEPGLEERVRERYRIAVKIGDAVRVYRREE